MPKYVYAFDEGNRSMVGLLGGKGANLAEMTRMGLPVPYGFTITTAACRAYLRSGEPPPGLFDEVGAHLHRLEAAAGKTLGSATDPLLVSVRSGAPVSMPGMMETVLNVGLNDQSVVGLSTETGDGRFAYDSYRRLVQMFGSIVAGVGKHHFEDALLDLKEERGKHADGDLDAHDIISLVKLFKQTYATNADHEFPQAPADQLRMAIMAVFDSWTAKRAVEYRRIHGLSETMATAVNVEVMVFGNKGKSSGTGVAFTRDPATGEPGIYGDYLPNAQGEDVVAGIRTPVPLQQLEAREPRCYEHLTRLMRDLELHFGDMCDIEFTIEHGRLWLLQVRTGKRTAAAAVRIAVDLCDEQLIDEGEAVLRVDPASLDQLLHRRLDPNHGLPVLARGVNASPGAAVGQVVFDSDTAVARTAAGDSVILVRHMTDPDDISGMAAAAGILTVVGGKTSHAAVVARGMGVPCVCGCAEIELDFDRRQLRAADTVIGEGDTITICGTSGEVIAGAGPLTEAEIMPELETVLGWADSFRRLGVRANADTGVDAARARAFGAEGIGLCRTEHMFMGDRLPVIRRVILAPSPADQRAALEELGRVQEEDFASILAAMDALPVTVRLLDAPLHEFLPDDGSADDWRELNPMLGLRGCRLGLLTPGLYEMQVRALFRAASAHAANGGEPILEIMVPLVADPEELKRIRRACVDTIDEVLAATSADVVWTMGTMIETPRAALLAADIVEHADFLSFGTNDLTQMTWGLSRDDVERRLLPRYTESKVIAANPFETIDRAGVGGLVRSALNAARAAKAIKAGVCGEHGGDPASIALFAEIGLDYVSCSPFRIPVARLAAAHAALNPQ